MEQKRPYETALRSILGILENASGHSNFGDLHEDIKAICRFALDGVNAQPTGADLLIPPMKFMEEIDHALEYRKNHP